MKNQMWVLWVLMLVFGAGDIYAQNVAESSKQAIVAKLRIEYRLRVHAQNMVSDMGLFDDLGMLGRGVPRTQVFDNQENTVGTSGGRFPDPSNPPSSALVAAEPRFEVQFEGFGAVKTDETPLQAILKDLEKLGTSPIGKPTSD